jgi:hypothetical protein
MIARTLFVSLVAACSLLLANGEALAADPTMDPCSLVTRAEVEQTIGKLKAAPRSGKNDRVLTCDYEFVDASNSLLVWVYPTAVMERARKSLKDIVPVKGLGEDARLVHHDPTFDFTRLFVKRGDAVVEVSVPVAMPGAASKVEALARKAVGRMK